MISNTQQILDTPIEYLKGVGPVRAELLKKDLNIFRFEDLLNYFPFRYYDKKEICNIKDVHSAMSNVLLKGRIVSIEIQGAGRSQRMTAVLEDATGKIELVWFQGIKWIREKVLKGFEYVVFGKPVIFSKKFNIAHPEIETVAQFEATIAAGIHPVYNSGEGLKKKGLDSRGISNLTETLLKLVGDKIEENLPDYIVQTNHLISHKQAIKNIHFPANEELLAQAEKRLKFEELLFLQLRILRSKIHRSKRLKGVVFNVVGEMFNNFYHNYLPFELTDAQKRVIKEIRRDTATGAQMNRLLQGDVGSGKTLVALLTMLIAIDNGYQTCMMAPTEILAQQHFATITRFLGDIPVNIKILTGSTKTSEKKKMLAELENGDVNILIGTHALIENAVQFKNLGFAVIDEQHRFGVEQRAQLWKKNHEIVPHVLVMTATPIPRTLAMTVYGDLNVSIIDELPPGRKAIKTVHYFDSKRLVLLGFIREQIKKGRQIYVVYPLIEESETLDLRDLMEGFESLSGLFPLPEYQIGVVHGKMKPEDKDFEMQRFKDGITNILIATTVIEVGVDVPNATVMVIESAERFGLSQLHQLRGRVGRGGDQSYCILMSGYKLSAEAKKRLDIMVQTTDGFKIAEADLKLRGPGDIVGTRQSGILDLKIASIVQDEKMVRVARSQAIEILSKDPELFTPENAVLKKEIKKLDSVTGNWGLIS